MSEKSKAIEALTQFIKQKAGVNDAIVCTVKSYDATNKTVYCEAVGQYADVPNARLIADKTKDGFILIPAINSVVIVEFMSDGSAYVGMVSKVSEIHLAGVNYGGLAKTDNVKTKLNALESDLNNLKLAIAAIYAAATGSPGVAVTNGTLGAFFSGVSYPVTALTLTTQASISSTVVKHGDGT